MTVKEAAERVRAFADHRSLNNIRTDQEAPWREAMKVCAEALSAVSASREPKPYDVMADAVCEIADAARQAFVKAGFDPGEWDSDNIVQDVKNGLVSAIETLAARSATATPTVGHAVTQQMYEAGMRYLRWKGTAWCVTDLYLAMDDTRVSELRTAMDRTGA
jgi:hypothetical protein